MQTSRFRFFVVGLPHTEVTKEYSLCAYTTKVRLFCRMMKDLGHHVTLITGGDKTDAPVDEFISFLSKEEQSKYFTKNWKSNFFDLEWDINKPYWGITNKRAAIEINRRKQQKDFICVVGGNLQAPIAGMAGDGTLVVEPFVGYTGTFANFRVFESYSHMHLCYGKWGGDSYDGRFYDEVIPGYCDPDDFPVYKSKDYLLYIGRMVYRKGLQIAVDLSERTNKKLLLAGQGGRVEKGYFYFENARVAYRNMEYLGSVDPQKRSKLMGEALATIVPTLYVEPFGNVAAESLMAGTPVLTTDWGAFTDYVENGVNGFRCRTLEEFAKGVDKANSLSREKIRAMAAERFSIHSVKNRFDNYFSRLYTLWDKGWYT